MTEENPINDSQAEAESAQEFPPIGLTPKDELAYMVKDSMSPSDWHECFNFMLQNKLYGISLPITTTENILSFMKYLRTHTAEDFFIDGHDIIMAMIQNDLTVDVEAYARLDDPDCRELMHKLNDYVESFQKYTKKLDQRVKAIHELSNSIALIDDPAVKAEVSSRCESLLDVHEEISFFGFSMEELRLKFEAEKIKYLQKKSNAPDALSDRVLKMSELMTQICGELGGLAQSSSRQEKKIDRLHEYSKIYIIRQEEIKGELPPGGIRFLKSQANKLPEAQLSRIIRALTKSGITENMWKLFWMNQDGMTNYDIAEKMGVHQTTIFRKMEELKRKLHDIGLEYLVIKYGTTKKQASNPGDRSGVGEYSLKAANMEMDDDGE